MITAGILEDMFQGYGLEYLWFDNKKNFALGFEAFDVTKRDYELRFGTLEYSNLTAHLNLYYRNYSFVPFDAKISYGEYLAGDIGATIELLEHLETVLNLVCLHRTLMSAPKNLVKEALIREYFLVYLSSETLLIIPGGR